MEGCFLLIILVGCNEVRLLAYFLIGQGKRQSLFIVHVIKNAATDFPVQTYRFSQEKLFYFLFEFALRTCYRYTSYQRDPEATVYEGFVKLFRSVGQNNLCSDSLSITRNELKSILIDACIEKGKLEAEMQHYNPENDILLNQISEGNLKQLSPKELIDALRMLPFKERIVFNLAVMDGFTHQEIASKLQLPIDDVKASLSGAREKLHKAIVYTSPRSM